MYDPNDAQPDPADDQTQEDSGPSASTRGIVPTGVDVHPLVLLSVVDHFNRINAKAAVRKRVAGLLLGSVLKGDDGEPRLDISTCFAVPFDEDRHDADVWFLDTNYAEEVWLMYRKVLPRIKVVGWYSSGPDICANDIAMHLLISERFCPSPVYCVVNTNPEKKGAPVVAYTTTESRSANAVEFRNVATNLGTVEAEDIGIEHLLRDLTDSTISTLSTKVGDRQLALLQLEQMLGNIETYLNDVVAGRLPVCTEVLTLLQEVTNLAPEVHKLKLDQGMVVATNDQALGTFVASIARAITALYDVILNRRKLRRDVDEKLKLKADEAAKREQEKHKDAPGDGAREGSEPAAPKK